MVLIGNLDDMSSRVLLKNVIFPAGEGWVLCFIIGNTFFVWHRNTVMETAYLVPSPNNCINGVNCSDSPCTLSEYARAWYTYAAWCLFTPPDWFPQTCTLAWKISPTVKGRYVLSPQHLLVNYRDEGLYCCSREPVVTGLYPFTRIIHLQLVNVFHVMNTASFQIRMDE